MSTEGDKPAAPRGRSGKAPRSHEARSFALSGVVHIALLAAAALVVHAWAPDENRGQEVGTLVRVERISDPIELSEEIIEPSPAVTDPDHQPEPELVEAPFVPTLEMPEDPPPPEALDWLPPEDLFAEVTEFKRPPITEPEPLPEPTEVEAEAVEPASEQAPVPRVLAGDDLPTVLEQTMPRYPRQAVRMRWHGTVVLRIRVDARGEVIDVVVHESSGHEVLDESAVEAFEKWVFRPREDGEPDVRLLQKPFTFRLN